MAVRVSTHRITLVEKKAHLPVHRDDHLKGNILLVAPNLSQMMGGEALKALQIHIGLRELGFNVKQVAHARVRDELTRDFPYLDVAYIEDNWLQIFLHKWRLTPLLGLYNAWSLHRCAERLAKAKSFKAVHFTSPISPVLPYFRFQGPPTVIGPLNGNIAYPPSFAGREPMGKKMTRRGLPQIQRLLGFMFRGKRAATILVAGGSRTEESLLLAGCKTSQFVRTFDSGIPTALFERSRPTQSDEENRRFVFAGRLVNFKGCDLAIRALTATHPATTLDIMGDGPDRAELVAEAERSGVSGRVNFLGWIPAGDAVYERLTQYRALVLPSLAEANGIIFQEAMVLGLPIICLAWGGASLLLDDDEAILIRPDKEEAVISGISKAMDKLGGDSGLAQDLSRRARAKADRLRFAWPDVLTEWAELYRPKPAGFR